MDNICDLLDELNFYRAKQAVLRAALNEIQRLDSEYTGNQNRNKHYSENIIMDTIQKLEYECADIESVIVQNYKNFNILKSA